MSQRTLNQIVYWLRRVTGPRQGSDKIAMVRLSGMGRIHRDPAARPRAARLQTIVRHEQDAEDAFKQRSWSGRQASSIRAGALALVVHIAQRSSAWSWRGAGKWGADLRASRDQLLAGSAELCD